MRAVKTGPDWLESRGKRAMDIFGGTLAIGPLMALGAVAAVAVGIENQHWPFFLQKRSVCLEEKMTILKIRTLQGEVDHKASPNGCNHERAVGRISRLVRGIHLDESFQILQAITGELSLVDPRPIVPTEYEAITAALEEAGIDPEEWHQVRKLASPGLINPITQTQHDPGYRNNPLAVALADMEYAEEASFRNDMTIFCQTVGKIGVSLMSQMKKTS